MELFYANQEVATRINETVEEVMQEQSFNDTIVSRQELMDIVFGEAYNLEK